MAKRQTRQNPTNQFESDRYNAFSTWQKVFFWIGVVSFLNLSYWLVRLIIYLVLQGRPLRERVDAYALQTLVFGVITAIALVIAFLVAVMFLLFLVPVAVTTSYG